MYTALLIMACGIVVGRVLRGRLSTRFIRHAIMGAIFLLLFLLGVSIGGNDELLASLPSLGMDALLLTLFTVGGSIAFCMLIKRFFSERQKKGQ